MTYQEVSALAGTIGTIMFVTMFAGAVLYALWPGNRDKFERASQMPLDSDPNETDLEKHNGRN